MKGNIDTVKITNAHGFENIDSIIGEDAMKVLCALIDDYNTPDIKTKFPNFEPSISQIKVVYDFENNTGWDLGCSDSVVDHKTFYTCLKQNLHLFLENAEETKSHLEDVIYKNAEDYFVDTTEL